MTTRRLDAPPAMTTQHDDDAPPASGLSSMQRAIMTIQKMRAKIENLERARVEPIAIIGMGCRFPGGANTPEAFFELLKEGVDAITEVPPERWGLAPEQSSDPEARAVRWGAFLRDVDLFDARFFGISPREASKMDPQQRLLLEVTWEALERAGQVPERLVGSRTGVFLGIMNNDYAELSASAGPEQEDAYTTTGNGHSFPSGRLSYTFGFQGPNIAVDTACSSSLVAIHLACHSLRSGECTMAVAGGVNLMLAPSTTRKYAKLQALSPDGRCKTFDATANGFVRGEGCGMVVLKRLSDAERDGDSILAIIRGSAVNQDGRSTGLTTPNVLAQQAMLTQALEASRLSPAEVGYVETHGTGTSLGDPIEVDALKAVLGGPRSDGSACVLGALKTNIGHLESAAGVAGLIKAVLVLQQGLIPRNNHFRTLNPRIQLDRTPFVIPTEARPWRTALKRRVAGVSSFGLSGTNAHLIVEEWAQSSEEDLTPEAAAYLLPLSAKSPEALRVLVASYRDYLGAPSGEARLRDIVYTASQRRGHFEERLSVVGGGRAELVRHLDAFLRGSLQPGSAAGKSTPARAKVVFVFSGQGSQWLGMGRKLYEEESSFRSVIDSCDALLTGRLGWSILDELDSTESMSRLSETQVAQPLIFSLQIALVELLRSWGITPDAVIGHGVGEIAAAYIAGILSLDEAIRLVAIRGRIMQKAGGGAKMVAVAAPLDVAREAIAGYEDRLMVGAVNDHESVVLAGQPPAMDEVVAKLERQGIACQALPATYSFQGPHMQPAAQDLVERLVRVDARRATLAMYSTVLAECVEGKELDVRYWGRNIRETVKFAGAVGAAIHDGYQLFLEVGPHPMLVDHLRQCLAAKGVENGLAVASLQRDRLDRWALLAATGALYTRGCAVEWSRLVPPGGRCVALPTYPWTRERYWVDPPKPAAVKAGAGARRVPALARRRPRVVFVFPGQGSQWLGMGRQLLAEEEEFRSSLKTIDQAIQREGHFSVLEELAAPEGQSRLGEIDVIQPVLFAIEVALAALWRSWGVEPDAVIGHSMGEVAAAHMAGKLDLADAAKVICQRSRLLRGIRGQGAMALVELDMAGARQALAGYEDRLGVAVSNGPRSTVLSGDPAALEDVLQVLEKQGVFCRRVKVDVASHSPQVEPLREELLKVLAGLSPREGGVTMISTVTGEPIHGPELASGYWWNNLREPVRFSQVVQSLLREGYGLFIEMSPHPILLPSIEENLKDTGLEGVAVASLRRQSEERRCLLESLAKVEAQGYPTARILGAAAREDQEQPGAGAHHPLLGRRVETSALQDGMLWQVELSLDNLPWIADHRVGGQVLLPGSVYIEAALAAACECIGQGPVVLEDVALVSPIVVREGESVLVEVMLTQAEGDAWSFKLSSRVRREDAPSRTSTWSLHATARVRAETEPRRAKGEPVAEMVAHCPENVSLADVERNERRQGLDIGPAFRAIAELRRGGAGVVARLRLPEEASEHPAYLVHPVLLDAALRATLAARANEEAAETRVLAHVRQIRFHEVVGSAAWVRAHGGGETSVALVDAAGRVLLEVDGITTQALQAPAVTGQDPLAHLLLVQRWQEAELPVPRGRDIAAGRWLILCDDRGIGASLREMLQARGGDVRCAYLRAPGVEPCADRLEIDSSNLDGVAALVRESFRSGERPRGIVYLWGLDPEPRALSIEALDDAIVRGCGGTLEVVQALGRMTMRDNPRLWLVVRGSQAVEQEPREVRVEQAPLWGLGRTIAMEAPELRCTRVDLDPAASDATSVEAILGEVLADDVEEEIARRGRHRFVARLGRPREAAAPAGSIALRADATYLITGGLGGVGLFAARNLATAGARHLVLMGRRGASSPEQLEALEGLRSMGVEVEVEVADVADPQQLEAALRAIETKMPPLRGILHTAGVLEDGLLPTQTLERFRKVLAPKVMGGWNLHRQTLGRELDFVLFYSSVAALLGSPGLGNYVAANAFLETLAHHRSRLGLVGTSIDWGLFSGRGMAVKADTIGGVSQRGIRGFTEAEAEALLQRALRGEWVQMGCVAIDFRQWIESHPQVASSPRFSAVLEATRTASEGGARSHARVWLESVAHAPPKDRVEMVEALIRKQLAHVLRMDPERIDRLQPLRALGIDSLMSLELRNRLEAALGIQLSATLVYAYPNLAALGEHVLKSLAPLLPHEAKAEPAPEVLKYTAEPVIESPPPAGDLEDDLLSSFDESMRRLKRKGRS
ncbi:type I polyketide synthase [Polyangium sp. 15x6]|uniref:type I polyketide synthase n=1 Tax=Polyangium sp. 15x6 TaxID=3042687 RepID=UPI00249CE39F|nr:type I polyketide synthase [Polyangium sp. 15x6]MDI3284903.1 SDR family NAD(P)-dependent oxidoreductase [Polyangium sp. 15x6]